MSAKPSSTSTASSSPSVKPIELLRSQYSTLYANLHPVLLLSVVFFTFSNLVRDPVPTLFGLAPTITTLQVIYCILCLPSTGAAVARGGPHKPGTTATATTSAVSHLTKRKTGKAAQPDFWAKAVPAFLSVLLTLSLTAPVLFIIVVLFGAPVTTHHPHTILLALHLALLTTPQLFYTHGLDTNGWLRIVSLQLPVDELYGMSLGASVGAWLGAIPIPLDWDREWQKWPVTIIVGMYAGAVVGKVLGNHVFKGRQMKIS